jgi:hypothetical protein
MTRGELVAALRELDIRLHSAEVQQFFLGQPQRVRDRFVSHRQEVTFFEGKLTNAVLESIATKLEELSKDLDAGVADLRRKLAALERSVAIINTLARVLGLVARVAALAA